MFDENQGPFARVRRSFDKSGKVMKIKEAPIYTDEDARRGNNAGYESASGSNQNLKFSSNVLVQKFLHIE